MSLITFLCQVSDKHATVMKSASIEGSAPRRDMTWTPEDPAVIQTGSPVSSATPRIKLLPTCDDLTN